MLWRLDITDIGGGDSRCEFDMNRGGLSKLYKGIRISCPRDTRYSCNVPILAGKDSSNPGFFYLILFTKYPTGRRYSMELKIWKSDLYTVAHRVSGGQWMEFDLGQRADFCENSHRLQSSGSYLVDSELISKIKCYRHSLSKYIKDYCKEDPRKSKEYLKFLMPLIVVICEGSRFAVIGDTMCRFFHQKVKADARQGETVAVRDFKLPIPSTLINNWQKISTVMIENDNEMTVDDAFQEIARKIADECKAFSEEYKKRYGIQSTAHACYI